VSIYLGPARHRSPRGRRPGLWAPIVTESEQEMRDIFAGLHLRREPVIGWGGLSHEVEYLTGRQAERAALSPFVTVVTEAELRLIIAGIREQKGLS
jgi:hypothetical protein